VELARKAALAQPHEPAHLDTYGWVLYLRGDLADSAAGGGAVTYLQKAVHRPDKPAGAEVYLHLGDAQWRTGDRKGAESSWKTALGRVTERDRERTMELYRDLLRRQTGLGAVDAGRFYGEHDASVATRARARLSAVEAGTEPPVTPMLGASAVQGSATK
jgi:Tfp pilus assembly protein PilF